MAGCATIAQFNLYRSPRQPDAPPTYRFLRPWAHPTTLARTAQAWHTESEAEPNLSFSYSVHAAERVLVVFAAFLVHSSGRRYTAMTHWQLLVDAWRAGGGRQPAGLRYVGIHNIVEPSARVAMDKEMARQRSEAAAAPGAGAGDGEVESIVEFTSASPYWRENIWIRSCTHVATNLSTPAQRITLARAWIVVDHSGAFNMVVEFESKSKVSK